MTLPNASQRALRQYIERIEKLNNEKQAIADDVKEVFDEAKGAGFNLKIMRGIIKLRKLTQVERDEAEALLATYLHAIESFDTTPLGEHIAAQERELEPA